MAIHNSGPRKPRAGVPNPGEPVADPHRHWAWEVRGFSHPLVWPAGPSQEPIVSSDAMSDVLDTEFWEWLGWSDTDPVN